MVRDELFFPRRLRRGRPGSERIFRVRIVINELREVREDVDFEPGLGWSLWEDTFPILAVGRWCCFSSAKCKRMFVLLGQSFWIDVWVPHHQRGHERVRH